MNAVYQNCGKSTANLYVLKDFLSTDEIFTTYIFLSNKAFVFYRSVHALKYVLRHSVTGSNSISIVACSFHFKSVYR